MTAHRNFRSSTRTRARLKLGGMTAIILALALAGCLHDQTPEERAAQHAQFMAAFTKRCGEFGYKQGTSEFAHCMGHLDVAIINAQAQANAAAIGAYYSTPPVPTYNGPRSCVTTGGTGNAYTTCN
jgi:hypothetical protein